MERSFFLFLALFFLCSPDTFARKFDPNESYSNGDWIKVKVRDLRPTQFVVGMKEVEFLYDDVDEILDLDKSERKHELKGLEKKVVIGPGGKLYLTEGHHHVRALYDRGAKWMFVRVAHDWSDLSEKEFWEKMRHNGTKQDKTHFYLRDETGKLRSYKDLPKSIAGLKDEPYRSLVYFLRKLKVLDKNDSRFPLYGEFEVVEYLRKHVPIRTPSGRLRFEAALKEAAFLITDYKNQGAQLPGQIRVSKDDCARALSKISDWL